MRLKGQKGRNSLPLSRARDAATSSPSLGNSGFTLLELVLATLISSLVLGIVSIALTFSLRTWEREKNRKMTELPAVIDLLKWQLASIDPTNILFEGQSRPVFIGDEHSLTFSTDYSVRAISKGVPVIARYVYIPSEKRLYYAEIPLDPYHPEPIEEFIQTPPTEDAKRWPRFYPTEMASFSFSLEREEKEDFGASPWEGTLPSAVLVKWNSPDDSVDYSYRITLNFLFPVTVQQKPLGTTTGFE